MNIFTEELKKCHNGSTYDIDCLKKLNESYVCGNQLTFINKKICNVEKQKLTNLIDTLELVPDFMENMLPNMMADMMSHCERDISNTHDQMLLTIRDNDTLSPERRTAMTKYPYNYDHGIFFGKTTFIIRCDKLSKHVQKNINIEEADSLFNIKKF